MSQLLRDPVIRKRIWSTFWVSALLSVAISILAEILIAPSSWLGAAATNVLLGTLAWSFCLERLRPYSKELQIGFPSAYFFVGFGLLLRVLGPLVLAISLSLRIQRALAATPKAQQDEEVPPWPHRPDDQPATPPPLPWNTSSLTHIEVPSSSAVAEQPSSAGESEQRKTEVPPAPARPMAESRDVARHMATKAGNTETRVAKIYSSTRLTIMSGILLGVLSLGLVWVYSLFAHMINNSREEDWNRRTREYESALAGYEWDVNSWQNGLDYATKDIDIATFLAAELASEDAASLLKQVNRSSEIIVPDDWRPSSREERAALDMREFGGSADGTASLRALVERMDNEAREKLEIANSEPYRSVMTDSNKRRAMRGIEARYREENPHPTLDASLPAALERVAVPSNKTRLWICGIIVLAHVCIGLTVQLAKGVKDG